MTASQLTRQVFRKLCTNQPILHYTGCLQLAANRLNSPRPPTTTCYTIIDGQRSFTHGRTCANLLKLFQRPKVQDESPEPGLDVLQNYSKCKRLRARLPSVEKVEIALAAYLAHCDIRADTLSDSRAKMVLDALHYIKRNRGGWDDRTALDVLRVIGSELDMLAESHRDLAMDLYGDHVTRRTAAGTGPDPDILLQCTRILCATRAAGRARDMLDEFHQTRNTTMADSAIRQCWLEVLRSYMMDGNTVETNNTLKMRNKLFGGYDRAACAIMGQMYAQKDKVDLAQKWHDRFAGIEVGNQQVEPFEQKEVVLLYEALFDLCIRLNERSWGQSLTKSAMAHLPAKLAWDLVIVWTAGIENSVEAVQSTMDTVDQAGKDTGAHVDISTINRLLTLAISRNDPYTAERYLALGRQRGLEADRKTLILQMEYRLAVNDLSGALTAYQHLQSHDLSGNDDVPAANRLLTAMCSSGRYDFDSVMGVAADLGERWARLTAASISALATLHLSRGEIGDVEDLFTTHVSDLNFESRKQVAKDMVRFCTDAETPTTVAWAAYKLLNTHIANMDRRQQTALMTNFFDRGRPDLGVHVFTHWRARNRKQSRATEDTYVACLDAVAKARDMASLEVVHSKFNVDDQVDSSTLLLDAFMRAYTACGGAPRALRFWDDIVASREGPSMASITLALQACGSSPLGARKAREIWRRLKKAGVELTDELWRIYAQAVTDAGDVTGLLDELDEEWAAGAGPMHLDVSTIGNMFNAAPSNDAQNRVQEMAEGRFLDTWAKLEHVDMEEDASGRRYLNLDEEGVS